MKPKITKNNIISSLLLGSFIILFNCIFSLVFRFLIWYWLIPSICGIFPSISAFLESFEGDAVLKSYDMVYRISTVIAIFPSSIFAFRMLKGRKKEFWKSSKSLVSYKDEMIFYYNNYGLSDLILCSALILFLATVFAITGNTLLVKIFPLASTMFGSFGPVLGSAVTLLMIYLSSFGGVLASHNKWRAEYFVGE